MATKPNQERGRFADQDRITGVDGGRSTRRLRPVLATIGLGAMTAVIYGAILFMAVVAVGELVARIPGLAGAVSLLTVGLVVLSAAPSVANWMVTRVVEFSEKD